MAALSGKVAEVKRGVQRASRELSAPFTVLEQRARQLRRVAQVVMVRGPALRPHARVGYTGREREREKKKVLGVIFELLGELIRHSCAGKPEQANVNMALALILPSLALSCSPCA